MMHPTYDVGLAPVLWPAGYMEKSSFLPTSTLLATDLPAAVSRYVCPSFDHPGVLNDAEMNTRCEVKARFRILKAEAQGTQSRPSPCSRDP